MITLIEVDGFKSLRDFSLSLREGLNVLVGPNGAGKTNILLYFEFLSSCIEKGVSRTVSQLGGAGSLFRKDGENRYVPKITSSIYGSKQLGEKYLYYEVHFEIALTEAGDRVYISRQCLNMKIGNEHTDGKINKVDNGFELVWTSDESGIIGIERDDCSKDFQDEMRYLQKSADDQKSKTGIAAYEFDTNLLFLEDALIFSYHFMAGFHSWKVRSELAGSVIYNFNPEAIRKPDDGASEPGIHADGSGLYSTLHAIKSNARAKQQGQLRKIPSPGKLPLTIPRDLQIDDVLEFIKLANDSIENVSVENDPFSNQLRIRVKVSGSEGENASILPLSLLSDGTVKWISLVTLILTNPSISCIEEPENYLHPRMQSIFIVIIRDSRPVRESSIILTTHSESLLNELSPEEVVCVRFENGRTIASRPSNMDAVQNEMNKTGFGLGYYYATDGLET